MDTTRDLVTLILLGIAVGLPSMDSMKGIF